MPWDLREQGGKGRLRLHLSDLTWQHQGQQEGQGQPRCHPTHGSVETKGGEQHAAQKEADSLQRVLGSREDRNPLEQLLFAPLSIIRGLRNHGFDGALGAHLVEVLGNTH